MHTFLLRRDRASAGRATRHRAAHRAHEQQRTKTWAGWKLRKTRRPIENLKLGRDGERIAGDFLDNMREAGRETYPGRPFAEVTVIAGARAGKDSRIAAPVAVFEAAFGAHARHLARGERGMIPLVAQDARAARIAFGYVKDYLTRSRLLASLVDGDSLASEIPLTNGLTVASFPCTLRSLRGWSIPVAVMDELAFFRLEGQADSDVEIQASIRRGMISFPTTRLVKISTPYMKSGILYDDFKRAFGQDDPDLLVWRAPSIRMNPALHAERLERERRLDPQRFAREYEAEFADDLEAFIPSAWVDEAVVSGRHELAPRDDVRYVAAVDPSEGGADAFTLAIVHAEGPAAERRVLQDVIRGWQRRGSESVDLAGVVKEIATLVRRYRLSTVFGDRYASGWVRERFRAESVRFEEPETRTPGDVDSTAYLDKSRVYLESEPLFAQSRVELLDHPQLARELKLLERRPRVGGKTIVDHPSGGHDGYANALALAVALAARQIARPVSGAVPSNARSIGERDPHTGGRGRGGGQVPYVERLYRGSR